MAGSEVPPMGETVFAGDLSGKHELVLIFLHGVGQQGAEVVQDFTNHCGACLPCLTSYFCYRRTHAATRSFVEHPGSTTCNLGRGAVLD